MSDLQSVPSVERQSTGKTPVSQIDTNAVLQRILQRLEAEDRNKIVLRCDELPMVVSDEENFETLFNSLLQMILEKKDEVPTLFLHISCTTEAQSILAKSGSALFTVQFNTNIVPCTNWFEINKDRLDELGTILAKYRGKLVVNEFRSSGSIFSVSLPGKSI